MSTSIASSTYNGKIYHEGFVEGLRERFPRDVLSIKDENKEIRRPNGELAGDIDLIVTLLRPINLYDLLPLSLACIQLPDRLLPADTTIFFELTSLTAEGFLQKRPHISKLEKKITFFNNDVPACKLSNSLVLFVYNGADPHSVKNAFEALHCTFNGGVVHFPRDRVSKWQEFERAEAERQRAEAERQRAEAERQRAEAERQLAEAERQRADIEKQRADQLQLELDALKASLAHR